MRECKHADLNKALGDELFQSLDLLLGSDLVYSSGCIPGVVTAIRHFLMPMKARKKPRCVILVNPDNRRGVMDGTFLKSLIEAGLKVETARIGDEPTGEKGAFCSDLGLRFEWGGDLIAGVHTLFGLDAEETYTAYCIIGSASDHHEDDEDDDTHAGTTRLRANDAVDSAKEGDRVAKKARHT